MSIGLGIDAGGTQTRWGLANEAGEVVASGFADGLSALEMGSASGRQHLGDTLSEIARAARALGRGIPTHVVAGLTGFGGGSEADRKNLAHLLAASLGVADDAVSLRSDVEIAYLDVFQPGEGYLVYAGTGAIGAFIDEARAFHRVGGHGGILDDAGSGFWIAKEAMKRVLREEDEHPGSTRDSILARELLACIDPCTLPACAPFEAWPLIRRFVYDGGFESNRGRVGRLALGVAGAAKAGDLEALEILEQAGRELARLARVLTHRFGPKPVAMAGRVFELHRAIGDTLRSELPFDTKVESRVSDAHCAAARIAARS